MPPRPFDLPQVRAKVSCNYARVSRVSVRDGPCQAGPTGRFRSRSLSRVSRPLSARRNSGEEAAGDEEAQAGFGRRESLVWLEWAPRVCRETFERRLRVDDMQVQALWAEDARVGNRSSHERRLPSPIDSVCLLRKAPLCRECEIARRQLQCFTTCHLGVSLWC